MTYTGKHPGALLVIGLCVVMVAALAPAGLGGQSIPPVAWAVWAVVFLAALALFRAADYLPGEALRRVAWLLPFVVLLAVPAGLTASPGRRAAVTAALAARALAAAAAAAALAALLGPAGVLRGLRRLRVPLRLVDITESTLVSLTIITRQAGRMLRAREARRPGFGAWSFLAWRPIETVRGFGRLAAALLLRSLERAESIDQARRARGGGEPW